MRLAILCSTIALATASASASTIQARYTGLALGNQTQTVAMRSTNDLLFSGQMTVYAGPLNHAVKNGVGTGAHLNPSSTARTVATFCTEVTQLVASGSTFRTFDIIQLAAAPKPGKGVPISGMGQLKAHAISLLWAGVSNKFTDPLVAAGFQIAVWEIVYDFDGANASTFNLTNGNIYFTSNAAARNMASSLFSQHVFASGNFRSGDTAPLKVMSHLEYQDQIVVIPLPAGGLLAATGLIGLAGFRRRR